MSKPTSKSMNPFLTVQIFVICFAASAREGEGFIRTA